MVDKMAVITDHPSRHSRVEWLCLEPAKSHLDARINQRFWKLVINTLWQSNMAMDNHRLLVGNPWKPARNDGLSIAMLVYQMVINGFIDDNNHASK